MALGNIHFTQIRRRRTDKHFEGFSFRRQQDVILYSSVQRRIQPDPESKITERTEQNSKQGAM
jgi:hypothetical protein